MIICTSIARTRNISKKRGYKLVANPVLQLGALLCSPALLAFVSSLTTNDASSWDCNKGECSKCEIPPRQLLMPRVALAYASTVARDLLLLEPRAITVQHSGGMPSRKYPQQT